VRAVGIPVFNEEANLADLLQFLIDEAGIDEIVAVDDCSSDRSPEILSRFAIEHNRVRFFRATERSGQLSAWRRIARESAADTICFIDADAVPARGACSALFDTLEQDPNLVAASGRTLPDADSRIWPAARFRAELVHRLRALQLPRHTIIGRFFAVKRDWFIATAQRTDIIANDAYLGGAAARSGRSSKYVPSALCYYGEAQTTFDFAAQRQRADAGYAQLRDLGIVRPSDAPRFGDYVRVIAAAALSDPLAAAAWTAEQLKARRLRAYRASGKDAGGWDVQTSTKRRLELPPEHHK
jgi:glycosyltransferase involved in cell wall biosynthesis